jgi:hypothetical protein
MPAGKPMPGAPLREAKASVRQRTGSRLVLQRQPAPHPPRREDEQDQPVPLPSPPATVPTLSTKTTPVQSGLADRPQFVGALPGPRTDDLQPRKAPSTPCSEDDGTPGEDPDLDELARSILPLIKRMLRVEQERYTFR